MKKLLLALGMLLVVGGGCLSLGKGKEVVGDWHLAFDLPSGWHMLVPYQEPDTKEVVPSASIDRDLNEVFLQSSAKSLVKVAPGESVPAETYATFENETQIRVSRLDPRRKVPSEAEDLGSGFFKNMLCEDGGTCQQNGRHNYDYYLTTESVNYKFEIFGADTGLAESIIRSAKQVTIPTETE